MAVFFWYLAKSELSNICNVHCTRVHWTSLFLQGTNKTRPCISCHPVGAVSVPREGGEEGAGRPLQEGRETSLRGGKFITGQIS